MILPGGATRHATAEEGVPPAAPPEDTQGQIDRAVQAAVADTEKGHHHELEAVRAKHAAEVAELEQRLQSAEAEHRTELQRVPAGRPQVRFRRSAVRRDDLRAGC